MSDRNKQPWTLEEEAKLVSLYPASSGHSISDIAETMGRSVNAIRCRAQLLGVSRAKLWIGDRDNCRPNLRGGGYVF